MDNNILNNNYIIKLIGFLCCSFIFVLLINIKSYSVGINDISDLKNVSISTESIALINSDQEVKQMLNNLITELRPYLGDAISSNISSDHVFTNKEAIGIIVMHPIKFLKAIVSYVSNTLQDTLNLASENAEVGTK